MYYNAPAEAASGIAFTYSTQSASPLLRLPAEIRNHILEITLPPQVDLQTDEPRESNTGDVDWINTSAVIFTCKQLYVEGRALAIQLHTFEWEKLPKQTRLCAPGRHKEAYDYKM